VAILRHLGFRRATERDRAALRQWIMEDCCGSFSAVEAKVTAGYAWCRARAVHISSDTVMERLVRSARHDFLEGFLAAIVRALPPDTRDARDDSLRDPGGPTGFRRIKGDPGGVTLDSLLDVCNRLAFRDRLDGPAGHLAQVDSAWIALLCRRVDGETAADMRRHRAPRRWGLYALYLMDRRAQLVDDRIDRLLEITHRMQTRSRRKVITRIPRDIERVYGKDRLLFEMAQAAVDDPEGRVMDVIYPVAGVTKLKAVIDEHRARGTLDTRIQTVMRGSCANHYRRMMPRLLAVLRFRSNNAIGHPVLDALDLIIGWRAGARCRPRRYPLGLSHPAGRRLSWTVRGRSTQSPLSCAF